MLDSRLSRKLCDQYRIQAEGKLDITTACVMSRIYTSWRKFGKATDVLKQSVQANPGTVVPEQAWRLLLMATAKEKLFMTAKEVVDTMHEVYDKHPVPSGFYLLLMDTAAAIPEPKFVSVDPCRY